MVRFAVETYGSLDILVNNAQSWGTRDQPTGLPVPTPLESFDDAELDWTFDTGSAERSGRCRPRSSTCANGAAGSSTSRPGTAWSGTPGPSATTSPRKQSA